jgi:hypothetical protein
MLRVGQCGAGIRDKEYLVIHHHRIPRCGFAADLRKGTRNDERIDATFLQAGMEIRRTVHEGAEAALDQDQILLTTSSSDQSA